MTDHRSKNWQDFFTAHLNISALTDYETIENGIFINMRLLSNYTNLS